MDANIRRIQDISLILMQEPWRILDNPFPPAVINNVGKALDLCSLRVEGLGDERDAKEQYQAAMRLLKATTKNKVDIQSEVEK